MKAYLTISGVIFAAVAVAHAARLIEGWPLVLGPFRAPMYISVIGVAIPAALAAWGLSMARKG